MAGEKNELGMDHKTTCWFAYVVSFISAIIVLATVKNDNKAREHAWQSLFFAIAYAIVITVIYIIMAILPWGFGLWYFFSVLSTLAWIGYLVVSVICIIKATQGDIFKIPVVYNFVEKQQ